VTSRDQDENMARILRSASNLIRDCGYNRKAGYEGEPGHSITSALCRAAGCERGGQAGGAHDADCEQAHARLAGYLYLTGRAGPGAAAGSWLPGVVIHWEDDEGPRPAAAAPAVLDGAAAVLAEPRGPRCGTCGHWAEGGTAGERWTDMRDHMRRHAAGRGFPVIPECPGCDGRGNRIRCGVCGGWIPAAMRLASVPAAGPGPAQAT
jgi:hypothetical protein